jgi:hypothetical protein
MGSQAQRLPRRPPPPPASGNNLPLARPQQNAQNHCKAGATARRVSARRTRMRLRPAPKRCTTGRHATQSSTQSNPAPPATQAINTRAPASPPALTNTPTRTRVEKLILNYFVQAPHHPQQHGRDPPPNTRARGQVGSRKHVPPWVEEERGKKRKSDTALTDGDHGDHPCGGSGQWARA